MAQVDVHLYETNGTEFESTRTKKLLDSTEHKIVSEQCLTLLRCSYKFVDDGSHKYTLSLFAGSTDCTRAPQKDMYIRVLDPDSQVVEIIFDTRWDMHGDVNHFKTAKFTLRYPPNLAMIIAVSSVVTAVVVAVIVAMVFVVRRTRTQPIEPDPAQPPRT